MTIPELFLAHNYKTHYHKHLGKGDVLYQKCIWDEGGITKKYYLNIWEWNWSKFIAHDPEHPITYSSEVQYDSHGDNTFNVSHHRGIKGEEDLLWLEAFYEEVYQKMNVQPYESD